MLSQNASLVAIRLAKGIGTVYAVLGLAAFLYFLPLLGEFKYSPPRGRDKNVFEDEVTLSLNEPRGRRTNGTWMETVSWHPRAAIIHNLLTDEECSHLIDLRKDNVTESFVTLPNGTSVVDQDRTSWGSWMDRYESKIIYSVLERVSLLTSLPPSLQESPYLLRYQVKKRVTAHYDFIFKDTRPSGPEYSERILTVLLYLSDVEAGGETNFTNGRILRKKSQELVGRSTMCSGSTQQTTLGYNTAKGIKIPEPEVTQDVRTAVPIEKGNALFFWSKDPSTVISDLNSLHEGCPVIQGTKWSITVWNRDYTYVNRQYPEDKDMEKLSSKSFAKRATWLWVPWFANRYY